ncbi:MAG: hypothetical protein AAFU71_19060 [Cyanobacteria bacterium J06632_22]
MPSSSRPYQSRLLRLVLSQFQQGMERQRQLWQHAKSALLRGAQATLYPIYVLMRTVRATGQQIGSAPQNLLHRFRRPQPATSTAAGQSTTAPPSLTSAPVQPSNLLPPDQYIIQALTTARQWQLPVPSGALEAALPRWLRHRPKPSPKVRGIAMDIQSRSLQLIDEYNCPLNILTDAQSKDLQHIISEGLDKADLTALHPPLPRSQPKPSSLQAANTASLRRLQPKVLLRLPFVGALFPAGTAAINQAPSETTTSETTTPQPTSLTVDATRLPAAAIHTSKLQQPASPQQPSQNSRLNGHRAKRITASSAWDVPIIESVYIEHPLEKLLRWLDQSLSWIESHITRLWAWISHATP